MDYFEVFTIAKGQTAKWNFPFSGALLGVYSDATVDIDIEVAGNVGHITTGLSFEPVIRMDPADVSALIITADVQNDATVTIRWTK